MKPYNLILRRSAIWFSRCGICPLWRAGFGIRDWEYARNARCRKYVSRFGGIARKFGSGWRDWKTLSGILLQVVRGNALSLTPLLGKLKQRRQRRQREWQKSNRFRLAKQHLCTCITLFFFAVVTQLRRRIRLGFHGGREHKFKTTALFFFSWTLIQFFRIQLQKQIHQHLTNCMRWNKSDFKV